MGTPHHSFKMRGLLAKILFLSLLGFTLASCPTPKSERIRTRVSGRKDYSCRFDLVSCGYEVLAKQSRLKCSPKAKPSETFKGYYLDGSEGYYILNFKISRKSKIIYGTYHNYTAQVHIPTFSVGPKGADSCHYVKSGLYGGQGGTYFNDHDPAITGINGAKWRVGYWFDGIEMSYDGVSSNTYHGGDGGNAGSYVITNTGYDKYITCVEGNYDVFVNSLVFTLGDGITKFGDRGLDEGSHSFSQCLPCHPGQYGYLRNIYGYSDQYLNSIGFNWTCCDYPTPTASP